MARAWWSSPLLMVLLGACNGGSGDDPKGPDTTGEDSTTTTTTGSTGAADSTGGATGTSGGATDTTGDTDAPPLEGYDDPGLWLCHPDRDEGEDQCLAHDLDALEIFPDGSTAVVEHVVAEDPAYDCFYVYPTVDMRFEPGQTEDFEDISQELDPLLNQVARFTAQCRVFAPLYHQVTIGTFGSAQAPALLDAAYQDIAAAFASYREHHLGDRPFVLLGHSQGTFMTTRLLQEVIEPDPALRDQLVVALMIGGSVSVPEGQTRGGTFDLPLCTSAEQTGCVLAYRTYAQELPPGPGAQFADAPGRKVACTDPSALMGHDQLAGAFLPNFSNQPLVFPPIDFGRPIDTPFVLYRDLYAAECLTDDDGNDYLSISIPQDPGDTRSNPVDFGQPLLNPAFLGLHVFDYNFPLAELMELVELKAAAM